MLLRAGSLFKDLLVLYSDKSKEVYAVRIEDDDLKFKLYLEDLELTLNQDNKTGTLKHRYVVLEVPVFRIDPDNVVSEVCSIADL